MAYSNGYTDLQVPKPSISNKTNTSIDYHIALRKQTDNEETSTIDVLLSDHIQLLKLENVCVYVLWSFSELIHIYVKVIYTNLQLFPNIHTYLEDMFD